MRITKRQLRRIIRESIIGDPDPSLTVSERRASRFQKVLAMIQEMGFDLGYSTWSDSNSVAVNDAKAAYPGEFTDEDVIAAVDWHYLSGTAYTVQESWGNPIGSGDPGQEIFDWAEEGNRVTIAGKNVWAGLGNRSGLHSYADELTQEKWAKSGDRFMKKIGKLPAGTEVELKRYQSTNRDRGNWVTAGTVTTIGPIQGSASGGEVPNQKRMRGILQDLSMAYDRDVRANELTVSLYQGPDAPFHGKNWEVTVGKSRMLFKDRQSDEYAEWDGNGWEFYTLY